MPQTSHTILIADDHPIFRQGLKSVLSSIPGITVLAEASNGREALERVRDLHPDILLLDLEMPELDGLTVLQRLSAEKTPVTCIVLTSYDDESYMQYALQLGARGFVLKDEAEECLVEALQSIIAGETFISPGIGESPAITPCTVDSNQLDLLTGMEKKVLRQVANFKTSKEIALDMDISYRTVQTHRSNICKKLGLTGANQLMQFARSCFGY